MKIKKESKFKKKIQKFKEIWNVPRYRSLIVLGIYAMFFGFIFILTSLASNQKIYIEPPSLNKYEKFVLEKEYQYTLNEQIIEFYNDLYHFEGNEYALNELPYEVISLNDIIKLLNVSVLESTNHIENYDTYVIEYNKYLEILGKEEETEKEDIKLDIYLKNDEIHKVIVKFNELNSLIIEIKE